LIVCCAFVLIEPVFVQSPRRNCYRVVSSPNNGTNDGRQCSCLQGRRVCQSLAR
jgi:hypothetical protein